MKIIKIGIDFGGEYLRIFTQNGLIFKEHSLIAVRKNNEQYFTIAIGEKAKLLQKNKDANILVFSPIMEGQIQSVEYASVLLQRALGEVADKIFFPKAKLFAMISIPSSLNIKQKENYIKVCKMAGVDKVDVVSAPICSLLGTKVFKPEDEVLIADLGASKCDFQIMKNYQTQKNATLGIGGNSIKNAINQMLFEKNFLIDYDTTTQIEKELASLHPKFNNFFSVDGVNTINHKATQLNLSSNDLFPITESFFEEVFLVIATLINEYQTTSNQIPAILISGGLGHTLGLTEFLSSKFPNTKIVIEPDTDTLLANAFQQMLY